MTDPLAGSDTYDLLPGGQQDILDRLRAWAKADTTIPWPAEWMRSIKVDVAAAIAEIERLRGIAGAVTAGQSFAQIRDGCG